MTGLSIIIIARDAAATIGKAVDSSHVADQVIVIVDDRTRDETADIARRRGAQVHVLPWAGYGAQKNLGMRMATGPWLFFLDADESISDELARKIQDIITTGAHDIYWVRIITVFLGRPLRHLFGHNPRLIKKGAALWDEAHVHEQLVRPDGVKVDLGQVPASVVFEPIIHYSHESVRSYLYKMHRYTTLDAKEMISEGRHRSGRVVSAKFWLPYYLASRQLLKLLFYRRGILDGWQGFLWCVLSAYYELELGRKFLKMT